MSNRNTSPQEVHECQLRLLCLCSVGEFCLQKLLEFHSARNCATHDSKKALSIILTKLKCNKHLRNIKTLNFKDNIKKVFKTMKKKNIKDEIIIDELDLPLVADILQSVPDFVTCKMKYRIPCKMHVKHAPSNSCSKQIVCCSTCMHCANCNESVSCTSAKLRVAISNVNKMRQRAVHVTNPECDRLLTTNLQGWKKELKLYSDAIQIILNILFNDEHITPDELEYKKNRTFYCFKYG